MRADYLIRGGRVIDPARHIDATEDIAVAGNRIVEAAQAEDAVNVIDASGCIITPGLIDFHAHLFRSGTTAGVCSDMLSAQGVTAAVDAGSAGTSNFEAYYRADVASSSLRLKSYLLPFCAGQVSFTVPEDYDPGKYDRRQLHHLFEKYPDHLLGLKVKFSKGAFPEDESQALSYLRALIDIAGEIPGCSVCVHVTDAAAPAPEIAKLLRPGDIYCHCYNGRGYTIYDETGHIYPEILDARRRGVIFDASNGYGNFSLDIAAAAIGDGFTPDVISTDITSMHANRPGFVKSLPYVMSKYLSLGMGLSDIVKAATATPARLMRMGGCIGTLTPGAYADIAIMREREVSVTFRDVLGRALEGCRLLVPQLTMLDGAVVYSQTDFWY